MKKTNTKKRTKTTSKKVRKVVGIGASAGGLEAIQQLFDYIPEDSGNAFIIIQHLSPDYKTLMPELLGKHTNMPIHTAEDKQLLEPNCIYLNQSTTNLHVKGDRLYQLDKGPRQNLNLPIDIFFHTLGEEFKENAIGVILSGTGSDGSRGIKTIKEAGGLLFAQSPESAAFDGMPNASISTGQVDFILDPIQMGKVLAEYPEEKLSLNSKASDDVFLEILIELEKFSGVAFKRYKRATLLRRMEKRINVNNLESLNSYLTLIKSSREEKEALFNDFLIGVTSFFRDYPAFELLSKEVFPQLCHKRDIANPIRIWVPGCSTGEEAYSIAMLLDHYLSLTNQHIDFKVFGTDIHEPSLERAGSGRFSMNEATDIDEKLLEKYFSKKGDHIEIVKRIRDKIVFSVNNVLKDPPFIRMDLISCRNLLIYLDNEGQNQVISNFLFSLNKKGHLFLGSSESLGKHAKEFESVHSKWKLFKTLHTNTRNFNSEIKMGLYSKNEVGHSKGFPSKDISEVPYYKFISDQYGPAMIFIDRDFNVKFIKGDAGKILQPKEGIFTNNLLEMVDSSFAAVIRNGIRSVKNSKQPVVAEINSLNGKLKSDFNLIFKIPDHEQLTSFFLIEVEEAKQQKKQLKKLENTQINDLAAQQISDLENELKTKREELRNLIEELETSNEELQSSNEELMASNEELQSTNEELQSVNEELYTVNSELQQKNDEVRTLYTDLSNLYSSQEISSIFLDKELCIRYFTPSIKKNLNLKESDIGRPLSNFMFFEQDVRDQLLKEASVCLDKGKKFEHQFQDKGRTNLMRIHPFINNKKIDGVVVTLIDVDELVKTQQQLNEATSRYEKLFHNLNAGFSVTELVYNKKSKPVNLIHRLVNNEFEELLGIDANEILNKPLEAFDFDKEVIKSFTQIAAHTGATGESQTFEYWFDRFNKHLRVQAFSFGEQGNIGWVFYDITKEKESTAKIERANLRLNLAHKISNIAIWEWNVLADRIENYNEGWEFLFEHDPETASEGFKEILHPEDLENTWQDINTHLQGESENYSHIFRVWKKSQNKYLWVKNMGKVIEKNDAGDATRIMGVSIDVTEEKNLENNYKRTSEELNRAQSLAKIGSWYLDIETNEVEWTDEIYRMYGFDSSLPPPPYTEHQKLFTEKSWQLLAQELDKTAKNGIPYDLTLEMSNKNASFGWMRAIGEQVKDNNGKVIGLRGIAQDVSEQKEYETKILKERAFRESLTEISTCGIFIFDVRLNQNVYINNKGAQLLGYSVEEIQGMNSKTFINQFHPADVDKVIDHINYLVDKKSEKSIKYRFKQNDGRYRYFSSTDAPFEIDKDGKLVSYIGSFIDITKQEEIEKELVFAKEEAEQASQQKDLFLSNMSHEIRTPLNGVIGFSKLLRKDNLSPKKRETYLEQIESNSQQLMTIINDVLNLSKIDSGSFELNLENINFHQTMQSIVDGHIVHLKEMEDKTDLEIVLTNKLPKKPIGIKTDEVRLSQVINNLITNAVKYSKKGTVEVGYKVKKKTIDIWVKDEGVGIKKDQLELIFQRFSQVHEKLSRQTGGIGLGLAISKAIADVLNGSISVESTYRKGSTFTLTIPYEPVEAPHNRLKINRKVRKVIVGDDSPSVQFYFKSLLEDYDIELLQAFDGSEVVNLLKDNEDVDLVFMDMRMPNMDGPTALQNLRKFNQDVKVVGQSAFAIEEQVEKFKSYGFDEYITKPIDEDKLKELINH